MRGRPGPARAARTGSLTGKGSGSDEVVWVYGGSLTMDSGTVSGVDYAKVVWLSDGGSLALSGGTVSGSAVDFSSFNNVVYVQGGSLTMDGGSVTGAGSVDAVDLAGGSFTLNDGTVTCTGGYDAVDVNEGSFAMAGGKISGSELAVGGVYVDEKGSISLSGGPVIEGGVCLEANSDGTSKAITITGKLTNTDPILVDAAVPGVFTDGLKGKGTADNFACGSGWSIEVNAAGEAVLAEEYDLFLAGTRVTSANAGDLSVIDGVTVASGGEARYDADTNTLYLKDATVTGSDEKYFEPAVLYVGNEDFTLSAAGTNILTGSEDGPDIQRRF